jgi:hypothetical protein
MSSAAAANHRTSWINPSRRAADDAVAGKEIGGSGEAGSSEARGSVTGITTGSEAGEGDGGTAPKGRAPETATSPLWRETGEQTSGE